MKVLIACEESQAVTIEMRKLGIEAYSCDILPCSGGYPEWHLQKDVAEILKQKWDMIIAFPPCTDLCVSGAKHFAKKRADGRQQKSIDFFMMFARVDCNYVVIENPIGIMSTNWRKPDQIIHPFWFGDNSTKSTCLWLKNLPKLIPSNIIVSEKYIVAKSGKIYDKWWFDTCLISDLKKRASVRSKTFQGIAEAMAKQYIAFIRSGMSILEWQKEFNQENINLISKYLK